MLMYPKLNEGFILFANIGKAIVFVFGMCWQLILQLLEAHKIVLTNLVLPRNVIFPTLRKDGEKTTQKDR